MTSFLMQVSAEETGTLEIQCAKDNRVLDGMHWRLYKTGHRENDALILDDDFSEYSITMGEEAFSLDEWNTSQITAAAETLMFYTITDKIPYRDEGTTDDNGILVFSGLEDGIYLLCGDVLKKEDITYVPNAILFEIRNEEKSYLNYFPKVVYRTLNMGNTVYTVTKIWKNAPGGKHPNSVTAELFCDGELQKTAVLNEENNWTYEWEDNDGHEWIIKEKDVPQNYTVVYHADMTAYLIINTFEYPIASSSITDIKAEPETQSFSDSSIISTNSEIDENSEKQIIPDPDSEKKAESNSDDINHSIATNVVFDSENKNSVIIDKLPQTGQLWWPVPPLICFGFLMIITGIRLKKNHNI